MNEDEIQSFLAQRQKLLEKQLNQDSRYNYTANAGMGGAKKSDFTAMGGMDAAMGINREYQKADRWDALRKAARIEARNELGYGFGDLTPEQIRALNIRTNEIANGRFEQNLFPTNMYSEKWQNAKQTGNNYGPSKKLFEKYTRAKQHNGDRQLTYKPKEVVNAKEIKKGVKGGNMAAIIGGLLAPTIYDYFNPKNVEASPLDDLQSQLEKAHMAENMRRNRIRSEYSGESYNRGIDEPISDLEVQKNLYDYYQAVNRNKRQNSMDGMPSFAPPRVYANSGIPQNEEFIWYDP